MNAFRKLSQVLYHHKRVCLLLAVISLALLVAKPVWRALAAPGDLDPTFSGDGKVDNLSLVRQGPQKILVQHDGKILLLHFVPGPWSAGEIGNFLLTRLKQDGSLDTGFGTNGKVETDFIGWETATSMVIQPNGRIIVAGYGHRSTPDYNGSYYREIMLVRYLPNGSLDTSFDGDGKVVGLNHCAVWDVALQSDGKIVVVGGTYLGVSEPLAVIARYNSNGSLDTTFNPGSGYFASPGYVFVAQDASLRTVAIQSDGKIVVAGPHKLLRYTASGQLDTTFGINGVVEEWWIEDLLVQNDGKILMLSTREIRRYDTLGNLDPGFGNNGTATFDLPQVPPDSWTFTTLVIQEDGRLNVAGHQWTPFGHGFLIRVNTNGTLDTGFGNGGYTSTTFPAAGYYEGAHYTGLSLHADERIIFAGLQFNPANLKFVKPVLARYKNDNTDTQTTDVGLGTITAAPTFPFSNTSWTYTIPVTNYSTTKAAHVTVTANVPTGTSFHSVTPPAGWAALQVPNVGATSGNISFSTYKLAPGATANVTFRVTIPSNTPPGAVILTIANVTNTIPDSNTSNNSASKLFYW